jgi:hypothetical protein
LVGSELTLLEVAVQLILPELIKDLLDVSLVLLLLAGVDEDIIEIYDADGVDKSYQCLANVRLERR